MASRPKESTNELINEINHLLAKCTNLPSIELDLMRIEKRAKDLLKSHETAYKGYTVIGAINCVRGKVDTMLENHETALSLSNQDIVLTNYYASLHNRWFLDDARRISEMFKDRSLQNYYYRTLSLDILSGDYISASVNMKLYSEFEGVVMSEFNQSVIQAGDFALTANVPQEDMVFLAKTMGEIMNENKLMAPDGINLIRGDFNELIIQYPVYCDAELCINMNYMLADKLSDHDFSNNFIDKISAGFFATTPSELELHHAG